MTHGQLVSAIGVQPSTKEGTASVAGEVAAGVVAGAVEGAVEAEAMKGHETLVGGTEAEVLEV